MRCPLPIFLLISILLTLSRAQAQSMVVGKPISDEKGMIAFEITDIMKVEGEWIPALKIGDLLYPQKRQKAHPIMRFGEAVVIALTEVGNRTKWQGLHVHNGCIPALQGKPLEEMVAEVTKQAKAEALAEKNNPQSAKAKAAQNASNGAEQFAVCPICHQRHIRIR